MFKGNRILFGLIEAWLNDRDVEAQLIEKISERSATGTVDGASMAAMGYLLGKLDASGKLPPEKAHEIRQYRHFIAVNTAAMMKDFDSLLAEIKKIKIEILLLKGAALLKAGVYPEKGLRLLSDIDILIRETDIPAFEKMLDGCGWKKSGHQSDLHEAHHLPVRMSPRGFPLEVHFALSRVPTGFDLEKIWNGSTPLSGNDFAKIPAVEDTLIQLALNTTLHHPEKIYALCVKFAVDFAFIWKRYGGAIDWDHIVDTVDKTGLSAPFWNVVWIVRKLINPPGLEDVMSRYGAEKIADKIFVNAVSEELLLGGGAEELSWLVVLAAEEKNPLKRILKIFRTVFPTTSYMKETYPEWTGARIPAAYIARIFNVVKRTSLKSAVAAYRAGKSARSVGVGFDDSSTRD